MIRFLLRRIPRFGFLTLFAAMLLFVSGAGWFNFQYDLYLEEERTLADLAKAECDVRVERYGDELHVSPPRKPPWYQLPAPFRRVQVLQVFYKKMEDRPLIERAASLPLVEEFDARYNPGNLVVPPGTTYPDALSYLEGKNVDLPPLPEIAIPDLDQPLPTGEALSEEEILATLEAWQTAWSKPRFFPKTGIVRWSTKDASRPAPSESIEIRGRDGFAEAVDAQLAVGNRHKLSVIGSDPFELREKGRQLNPKSIESFIDDPGSVWLHRFTGCKRLELAASHAKSPVMVFSFGPNFDRSEIESIQRTDGGSLRIDFRPTIASFPAEGIEDRATFSVVYRPDWDFAVEAYDVRIERTDAIAPEPIVWTPRLRSVSSDHGGAYLVDAYAIEEVLGNGPWPAKAPSYFARRLDARFAYDFATEPSAELFEPATYGAIEFPPPRPLPLWRWYRVTFAISVALLAFVVIRRLIARVGKVPASPDVPDPTAASSNGRDSSGHSSVVGPGERG